jgi:hypothetical protein
LIACIASHFHTFGPNRARLVWPLSSSPTYSLIITLSPPTTITVPPLFFPSSLLKPIIAPPVNKRGITNNILLVDFPFACHITVQRSGLFILTHQHPTPPPLGINFCLINAHRQADIQPIRLSRRNTPHTSHFLNFNQSLPSQWRPSHASLLLPSMELVSRT